jgi:hypothetical protein
MRRTFTAYQGFSDLLTRPLAAPQSPPVQQAIDACRQRTTTTPSSCSRRAFESNDSRVRAGGSPRDVEILAILEARKVRGLIHFTPMQNLTSILRFGLIPRSQLETLQQTGKTSFTYTDCRRHDGKDSTCLSICFPNAEMFYRKRCENAGWSWVVLVVEPQDIVCHPATRFSEDNAARSGTEQLAGARGLRHLYGTSPLYRKRPVNPQAEVRVPRVIDPTLIKYICCEKEDDLKAAQSLLDMGLDLQSVARTTEAVLATEYFSNPPWPRYRDMPHS